MVRRHTLVAGAQKTHGLLAVHEGDVRHGVDELARVIHHPAGDGVAPELPALLELREDLDRFGAVDRTVLFAARRVA